LLRDRAAAFLRLEAHQRLERRAKQAFEIQPVMAEERVVLHHHHAPDEALGDFIVGDDAPFFLHLSEEAANQLRFDLQQRQFAAVGQIEKVRDHLAAQRQSQQARRDCFAGVIEAAQVKLQYVIGE
jgi:hypothetical protein